MIPCAQRPNDQTELQMMLFLTGKVSKITERHSYRLVLRKAQDYYQCTRQFKRIGPI